MTISTLRWSQSASAMGVAVSAALAFSTPSFAHDGVDHEADANNAYAHAPIGVMGDHLHKAGEIMFSYRFMHMDMDGNRSGTNSLSPEEIVTTVPNRFAGPPTLRVVPTEMTMDMHMFGAMYAPTDDITLMLMGMYLEKEMDHVTFRGMAGTTRLGTFTTKSSGIGDTKASALVSLHDEEGHKLHANLGVSIPTGSITESDTVLTPMGTRPTLRLPYAMQLGSGTFDLEPGLTYTGTDANWGWGAQWRSTLRTGTNDEGYTLGNKHQLTAWSSYQFQPWISLSGRLTAKHEGTIEGFDPRITAPVQTADPDNFGGERVEASIGLNLAGQSGFLKGHRLAFEVGTPIYENLNGPQMETDLMVTIGWQKAF